MFAKKLAAEKAVDLVKDGMIVGLGTGTTAFFAIQAIAGKIAHGLTIRAVASSLSSEKLAREAGIPVVPISEIDQIDLTIDGADEVDTDLNLTKGGGGALTREKILAQNSKSFVVIVDESKLVRKLGAFPLAVEIIPFAVNLTKNRLEKLGCKTSIRLSDKTAFRTDNGNLIADCSFDEIQDPENLNTLIQLVPGVVECGLFPFKIVDSVIVGYVDGSLRILKSGSASSAG